MSTKNNCPFPSGAAVVAYLRDSGGEDQDQSVTQQEQAVREYCQQNGLVLTKVFPDEAAPGSSAANRVQFQEMIHHFHNEPPELGVLVWKFSRFARNLDDAQFYRADLRRRGYIIHSLNDAIPAGADGRFFEAAVDWMNTRFLDDLSLDVKRGLRLIVEVYRAVPGRPPRGFRGVPVEVGIRRDGTRHILQRWEPDPELIPLVKKAFEMRARGEPLRAIHAQTGLYKSIACYSGMFRNKIFIGVLNYAGLTIPDYCPPVIDLPTWEKVNQLTTQRGTTKRGKNHPWHLADLAQSIQRSIAEGTDHDRYIILHGFVQKILVKRTDEEIKGVILYTPPYLDGVGINKVPPRGQFSLSLNIPIRPFKAPCR